MAFDKLEDVINSKLRSITMRFADATVPKHERSLSNTRICTKLRAQRAIERSIFSISLVVRIPKIKRKPKIHDMGNRTVNRRSAG